DEVEGNRFFIYTDLGGADDAHVCVKGVQVFFSPFPGSFFSSPLQSLFHFSHHGTVRALFYVSLSRKRHFFLLSFSLSLSLTHTPFSLSLSLSSSLSLSQIPINISVLILLPCISRLFSNCLATTVVLHKI